MTRAAQEVTAALKAAAKAQRATAAALEALAEMVGTAGPDISPVQHQPPEVDLLTVKQAAKQIGMSEGYVYRAIEENRLPVVRMGNRVRIRPAALAHFVERRELAPQGAVVVPLRHQAPVNEEGSQTTESGTESPRPRPR